LQPHGPAASAAPSSSYSISISSSLHRRQTLLPHRARPHASPPATIQIGIALAIAVLFVGTSLLSYSIKNCRFHGKFCHDLGSLMLSIYKVLFFRSRQVLSGYHLTNPWSIVGSSTENCIRMSYHKHMIIILQYEILPFLC
jgi:hypothetical protein